MGSARIDVVSVDAVMARSSSAHVADVRGEKAWVAHHLPGSIDLAPDRFASVEDAVEIARRLGAAGISREDALVLYDDGSGANVGRMVWLLDRVEHPHVTVLDGGITAWHAAGQPLESGAGASLPAARYDLDAAQAPYENLATTQWILDSMGRADVTLVDTRSEEEYRGSKFSLQRTGHIPGAVWMEWSETLVAADGAPPRFATAAELTPRLDALGITQDQEIVCYCQVGARSAQVYGVLRMLGYPRVKNYFGSWAEWSARRDTPAENG